MAFWLKQRFAYQLAQPLTQPPDSWPFMVWQRQPNVAIKVEEAEDKTEDRVQVKTEEEAKIKIEETQAETEEGVKIKTEETEETEAEMRYWEEIEAAIPDVEIKIEEEEDEVSLWDLPEAPGA
jgi:hypothetical protein